MEALWVEIGPGAWQLLGSASGETFADACDNFIRQHGALENAYAEDELTWCSFALLSERYVRASITRKPRRIYGPLRL